MKKLLALFTLLFFLQACEPENDNQNSRTDYLGNWTCNEYEGDFSPQTYNVEIFAIGSGNEVGLSGIYNQGSAFIVTASISGSSIFINNQTVDGITLAGSGTLANSLDRIDLTFSANDGSGSDNVKATLLR